MACQRTLNKLRLTTLIIKIFYIGAKGRINRSVIYYEPRPKEERLKLLRLVDEIYTKYPFMGSRQMSSLGYSQWPLDRTPASRTLSIRFILTYWKALRLCAPVKYSAPISPTVCPELRASMDTWMSHKSIWNTQWGHKELWCISWDCAWLWKHMSLERQWLTVCW